MNTPINDGGPAFPSPVEEYKCLEPLAKELYSFTGNTPGMTLRDWFAGRALAGSIAATLPLIGAKKMTANEYAESCFGVADAMIAARSTQPSK